MRERKSIEYKASMVTDEDPLRGLLFCQDLSFSPTEKFFGAEGPKRSSDAARPLKSNASPASKKCIAHGFPARMKFNTSEFPACTKFNTHCLSDRTLLSRCGVKFHFFFSPLGLPGWPAPTPVGPS